MTNERNSKIAMEIISYAGSAKSNALLSLEAIKSKNFAKQEKLINDANELLAKAAIAHFELLKTNSKKVELNLLLIHAEDHFTSANVVVLLVKELIEIYKKIEM